MVFLPRGVLHLVLSSILALFGFGFGLPSTEGRGGPEESRAGTRVIHATLEKDVMAKSRFPSTGFGAEDELQVSARDRFSKVSYLQFSVSGVPADAVVVGAELRLRSDTSASNLVTVHAVPSLKWTESGLTWDRRPSLGIPLSTVGGHAAGYETAFPVESLVTGNGWFAMGLSSVGDEDVTFSSREGSSAPVLLVTYVANPHSVFRGNTHAHTTYTSSHGQVPPDNGPPAEHHALAKAEGYDFYTTTDHSQEVAFNPTDAGNAAWVDTKVAAAKATDGSYVGLAGYEHSENDAGFWPGTGHINVINSDGYLDALEAGVDLPRLYEWLASAAPYGDGPVVATFNHAHPLGYHTWAYRTPEATQVIALLEMVNSMRGIHEEAFRAANNAGWKVAPTCGNDNHGFWGIFNASPCVGVLADARTKAGVLDAMRSRRTFTTTDENAVLHYRVNGVPMGSTLDRPTALRFVITASDPDVDVPGDRFTQLEVVDGAGTIVASTTVSSYDTTWTTPVIAVAGRPYLYVRAHNVQKGTVPMAWAAPVWTGH